MNRTATGTPKKSPELKASTVRRLLKSGLTSRQVAEKVGLSYWTLYYRFGEAIKGISPRGRRPGTTVAKPKAKSKAKVVAKKPAAKKPTARKAK